jgi:hypothetical protein
MLPLTTHTAFSGATAPTTAASNFSEEPKVLLCGSFFQRTNQFQIRHIFAD